MKVLHLPVSFFPDHVGGKEFFTYQIASELNKKGIKNLVAYHLNENKTTTYRNYKGIDVFILPELIKDRPRYNLFSSTFSKIAGFKELLEEQRPDIVHFHDQNDGASLSHLRIVKEMGIKSVISYHSPGQSCLQRALLKYGTKPCNGYIDINICSKCRLVNAGLPYPLAVLFSKSNLNIGNLETKNRFLNLLHVPHTTKLFKEAFNEFYSSVDGIQVHTKWVKEMLILNGVDKNKIHYFPLGGHSAFYKDNINYLPDPAQKFMIVFNGRCTDIKGVHLLIKAVKKVPEKYPVEVHFLGPGWDQSGYGKQMLNLVGKDQRFLPPRLIEHNDLLSELSHFHLCVVPSIWPETGPFTVLDSLAAGVPVLGSDFAGIRELASIHEGIDLFEWNSVTSLKKKLIEYLQFPEKLKSLRKRINIKHDKKDFSESMLKMYKKILNDTL